MSDESLAAAKRLRLVIRHIDQGMSEFMSLVEVYGGDCARFTEDIRNVSNHIVEEHARRKYDAQELHIEWRLLAGHDPQEIAESLNAGSNKTFDAELSELRAMARIIVNLRNGTKGGAT